LNDNSPNGLLVGTSDLRNLNRRKLHLREFNLKTKTSLKEH